MILFEQNSILVFNSSIAEEGRAVYSESNITIKGNSQIVFNDNSAINGGATACYSKCPFLLVENSVTTFTDKSATSGGAICLFNSSNIIFDDNTIAEFTNYFACVLTVMLTLLVNVIPPYHLLQLCQWCGWSFNFCYF